VHRAAHILKIKISTTNGRDWGRNGASNPRAPPILRCVSAQFPLSLSLSRSLSLSLSLSLSFALSFSLSFSLSLSLYFSLGRSLALPLSLSLSRSLALSLSRSLALSLSIALSASLFVSLSLAPLYLSPTVGVSRSLSRKHTHTLLVCPLPISSSCHHHQQ
jgi:hypothetical protein